MPSTTTARLMASLAAALEAVVPCEQLASDDTFAIFIGERPRELSFGAQRTVHLTGAAGRRANNSAWCDEWETVLAIENTVPLSTGYGHNSWSSVQMVIEDAEALLEAAYTWAAAQPGVTIDPQPAPVQDTADNVLVCVRGISLRYQRTE